MLEYGKSYSPSEYAKAMAVEPPRISQLKDKLIKEEKGGKWFPVHCIENDELFKYPMHNSLRFKLMRLAEEVRYSLSDIIAFRAKHNLCFEDINKAVRQMHNEEVPSLETV